MAVIDLVKWDAPPNVLAWKFPSSELSTWTQLIVSESQEALLLKEGQFVGPFPAGRHVLSTENYPVLTEIFKLPFGKSPFTAEIWFIQKAFTLNAKWGTVGAIQLEDPKFHLMLPVQAYGQYGIQIKNSRDFLAKMVGTLPAFTVKTLQEYFKGIILTIVKDSISKYLVQQNISIIHIAAHLSELSEYVEKSIDGKIETYGVKICNFSIVSITTDEKDPAVARVRRALAERAEMEIMGFNYQQKRSFDVMETAAGNDGANGVSGNIMGAGMGMAMGMGIGQSVTNNMPQISGHMSLNNAGLPCPNCGTTNHATSKFCQGCGSLCSHTDSKEETSPCPSCNAPSPATVKFCPHCGTSKTQTCTSCGEEIASDFRFCAKCGTPTGK